MKIPYTAIGCADAERSGALIFQQFIAKSGEHALEIAGQMFGTDGDEVYTVILNHALPIDPAVVVATTADFVKKVKHDRDQYIRRIEKGISMASLVQPKVDKLSEYLSWVESVSLE